MACKDCNQKAVKEDARAALDALTMTLLSEAASVIRSNNPELTAALERHVAAINAAGNAAKKEQKANQAGS